MSTLYLVANVCLPLAIAAASPSGFNTDTSRLLRLLKGVEIRIRKMQ